LKLSSWRPEAAARRSFTFQHNISLTSDRLDYLRIENAEGYVFIAVYLFIYLYACSSHNKKSFKPNRMTFGGMIGYYPGTI